MLSGSFLNFQSSFEICNPFFTKSTFACLFSKDLRSRHDVWIRPVSNYCESRKIILNIITFSLVGSILSCMLCCMPIGGLAIAYAYMARSAFDAGRTEEAARMIMKSVEFTIAAVVIGTILIVAYFAIIAISQTASFRMQTYRLPY